MWPANWRQQFWQQLGQGDASHWDVIIIGGGITGAGLLREAARVGARALLLERDDFASGTSSWSSKLVHGGLRYLASGKWRLTLESVRERQDMLKAAPGLVDPLNFLLPMYADSKPGRLLMGAALTLYDLMARQRYSSYLGASKLRGRMPQLEAGDLRGGFAYMDASTDDARLVLRVLGEAVSAGGMAANYLGVTGLLFDNGRVAGVQVRDAVTGDTASLKARAVINAAGPWVDQLRGETGGQPRIRPLRGSHFLFPYKKLPLNDAVTLFHPRDRRPLFAFPWEGVTLFGTTDLDHPDWPASPARMTAAEAAYLEEALAHYFPAHALSRRQALSAYSGIRPVINTGATSPSAESREHALWCEQGMLTVTGGKLTTFRGTAVQALRQLADRIPALAAVDEKPPVLAPSPPAAEPYRRMAGRFGPAFTQMQAQVDLSADLSSRVADSVYHWAELQWSLRHEAVERLGDLMLRRTRLGLLLPAGGEAILDEVGLLCRRELGWDAPRWQQERDDYLAQWRDAHNPPDVD